MNRKFKAISLALVAVFALSAVAASSATATPPKFTAASYPAQGSGSQPAAAVHKFNADGFTTTCEVANFTTSVLAGPSSEITVTPEYDKCKTAGVSSKVTLNGCAYIFTMTTTNVPNLSTVTLECPEKQEITIDVGNPAAPTCVIHVPPFKDAHHAKLENKHPNILATATVTVPLVHLTDTTALCPFNGNTTSTALYEGSVELAGKEGKTIDIG
jgi:hypothetical protein